ncbi:MAG TPA: pyridoxamine 5'-phosphate oxidase family protein [Pseudonocardiaceae bacterium]|nr:pyridoxamine 5'-phosphate oxidase family protein [Pseudonocardiaceae bacterium]
MTRTPLSPTERSTVGRHHDRAAADRAALDAVLDAGLICHLGFVLDGAPVVLPTGYGHQDNTLYLHGSSGARSLRIGAGGAPVCVTVTMLDGIVYARSVFSHSMNYRSAVIHGQARLVADEPAKLHALRVITDHLAPGSWDYAREPTRKELAATTVLALDLTESSVKVRTGGPGDEDTDLATGSVWAGVLPVRQVWGELVPAEYGDPELAAPPHVAKRAQPC